MYLNAETRIPFPKKTVSIGSFKFFQNVNTMEQNQKDSLLCSIFNFFDLKKEFGSASLSHHSRAAK